MTLKEQVQEHKRQMDAKIAEAVEVFTLETGMSVTRVELDIIVYGGQVNTLIITEVKLLS